MLLKNRLKQQANNLLFFIGLLGVSTPLLASGFLEDSKASLQFRNFYFNDNYRDPNNEDRKEWAQGFILKLESGYTEGDVGFGLDALGLWGVRLDSSPKHAGTGLLPVHDNGKAAREFASYGLTAKMKIFDSTKISTGTQLLKTPLLVSNDGRLLPQTFTGTRVNFTGIKNLELDGTYLSKFKQRNSTNNERLYAQGYRGHGGNSFWFTGGNYKATKTLKLSYYYGQLEDFYQQQYVGFVHQFDLPKGDFTTDVRYFISKEDGAAKAGRVDNNMLSMLFTYHLNSQSFGLGYQKLNGATGLPYIAGATVYSFSNAGVGKFINPHEQTWMLRYDLNFESLGLPGLNLMTRYYKADNQGYQHNRLKEWERDTYLSYAFQSKVLKGLKVEVRNTTYRTQYRPSDRDNARFYLTYTLQLK